jgi:hypothetical protein
MALKWGDVDFKNKNKLSMIQGIISELDHQKLKEAVELSLLVR